MVPEVRTGLRTMPFFIALTLKLNSTSMAAPVIRSSIFFQ
jgi:hypothetical protein